MVSHQVLNKPWPSERDWQRESLSQAFKRICRRVPLNLRQQSGEALMQTNVQISHNKAVVTLHGRFDFSAHREFREFSFA